MTRNQAYIVTGGIAIVVLSWLFWPQPARESPRGPEATSETVEPANTTTTATAPAASVTENQVVATEVVTVSGTYVGLRDEVGGEFVDTPTYLLLDDGTEIISIDLRPLIGTQKTGIEAELGIVRGNQVELTGEVEAGTFIVREIKVLE